MVEAHIVAIMVTIMMRVMALHPLTMKAEGWDHLLLALLAEDRIAMVLSMVTLHHHPQIMVPTQTVQCLWCMALMQPR